MVCVVSQGWANETGRSLNSLHYCVWRWRRLTWPWVLSSPASLEWHVSLPHSTLSLLTQSLQPPHAAYIIRYTLSHPFHTFHISFVFSISLTPSLTLPLLHLLTFSTPLKAIWPIPAFTTYDNKLLNNKHISCVIVLRHKWAYVTGSECKYDIKEDIRTFGTGRKKGRHGLGGQRVWIAHGHCPSLPWPQLHRE